MTANPPEPLLSLCIPTFNRADLLRQMLEHLTSLDVFRNGPDIEAVIVDNASTDDTPTVGETFAARHPGKIRFYRNETNIEDRSFGKALSLGRGVFLRLSNDTLLHSNAGLLRTLDVIRRYRDEKPLVCLHRAEPGRPDLLLTSLDALWLERSYLTTWIAEFGVWKSDFTSAEDFARAAETHLTQVDFLLRLMSAKRRAVVVDDLFFTGLPRKSIGVGGVNSARVFGVDYLDLLHPYVVSGALSSRTFDRERWRVFRYLILPNALITRPGFQFPKDGFVRHLAKHYWFCWYFWLAVPAATCARVVAAARRRIGR